MEPLDYSAAIGNPMQALGQAYAVQAGIRNDQQQQQMQQIQLDQMRQQQQVLQNLVSNPNASAADYSAASLLVPGMREQLKQAWDMKNTDQQQQALNETGQWFAAVSSGQPKVAASLMRQRAAAMNNTHPGSGAALEALADVTEAHPEFARSILGMRLAAAPGGDKVIAAGQTAATLPSTVAKAGAEASMAKSDAQIKAVAAGNAQTAATLDNENKAQQIRASQLQGQISLLDTQIRQADSETRRGELQLQRDKLNVELQQLNQKQGVAAQDSQNATTNALQTVDQIKTHPAFKSQEYGGVWSKIKGYIPGTDRQALEGWVDTLKGQLSYQNLMAMKAASPNGASGLGALSEGEQRMLSNLAGNLDLNSADFPKQLNAVQRFLQKAQSTTVSRGQLPATGEAFVMRHPVYGNVTEGQINGLMKQFPGSTREQILTLLQTTGGK